MLFLFVGRVTDCRKVVYLAGRIFERLGVDSCALGLIFLLLVDFLPFWASLLLTGKRYTSAGLLSEDWDES